MIMFLFQPLKGILAAKINDVDEDNSPGNAQSKEEAESSISTEVREQNDNGEEFTPSVDGEYEEGDNTELEWSQHRYPEQQTYCQ